MTYKIILYLLSIPFLILALSLIFNWKFWGDNQIKIGYLSIIFGTPLIIFMIFAPLPK